MVQRGLSLEDPSEISATVFSACSNHCVVYIYKASFSSHFGSDPMKNTPSKRMTNGKGNSH